MTPSPEPASARSVGKAKTREKLLRAAVEILIEDGYAGFSMNKVAKRAGIAQPSFYAHFENTDQLLEGLADDLLSRYLPTVQTAVHTMVMNVKADDARPLVQQMFLLAFNVVRGQQRLVRMVWAEREQRVSPFGERLRALFIQIKDSWAKVLLETGLVPRDASQALRLQMFMDSVFAMFEAYACAWFDGRYQDAQPLADALTDYVMDYWQAEMAMFFGRR